MNEKTYVKAHELRLIVSEDNMAAYFELDKIPLPSEGEYEVVPLTEEELREALSDQKISFGIDEVELVSMAQTPQWASKVKIAKGIPPIDGDNGYIEFFVKRDKDYKPEIDEDAIVDYKNLEYFQMVSKGQPLCEITKATLGQDGTNVFGNTVQARPGRNAPSPRGKNTVFDDEERLLLAETDGIIRFIRDTIDVNNVLQIPGDVDLATGNIRFSGDIIINGDVNPGYTVESESNIIIRGVSEGADIKAQGDLQIGRGINGTGNEGIFVGGDLKCGYIENACVKVCGNIASDYIINSETLCMKDITLKGGKELIIGGTVQLYGVLAAKCIGSDREIPTKIVILGREIKDTEGIEKLAGEIKEHGEKALSIKKILEKYDSYQIQENEQLSMLREQFRILSEHVNMAGQKIKKLEAEGRIQYDGSIECKNKIYRGVKIFFGDDLFQRPNDDIERCKIFMADGEIILGTL